METSPSSAPITYKKLTGLHRSVGQMSQLWSGGDHLLHVLSTGYSETYRRFYLRDIQSILIVHSSRRFYILAGLILFWVFIIAIIVAAGGTWVAALIALGCLLPLMVWNHLRGPGCTAVLVTAVHQEKIPSLSRLPKTRKILADLKPLIDSAQADFVEKASAAPAESASSGDAPAGVSLPPGAPSSPPSLPPPLPPPLPQ